MNFGELFAKTLSASATERDYATKQLETAQKDNYPSYLLALAQELANNSQQPHLRSAAGIALKNALTARDYSRKTSLQQAWIGTPEQNRAMIKQLCLATLNADNVQVFSTAGQIIAAIADIELPRNEWTDLIPSLLNNVATASSSALLKQASLQTIGFICEEVSPEHLEQQSDSILTAVVSGARKEEQSPRVRVTALEALENSMEFIRRNFGNSKERDYIMQIVCEATTADQPDVVVAAFKVLVRIIGLYYDFMPLYMQHALYALTVNGMKNTDARVCLQAVEFWSTVCDEEIDLENDAIDAAEFGEPFDRVNHNFAKVALPTIVPVLLFLLTKQSEDLDEDEWSPAMAAGTCLALFAQCTRNDVVGPVVPFVEQNIQNSNWKFREAAVMAFGSILDGPESSILQNLVTQALPVIVQMMKDPVVQVKDTAAWTLGRICELHPDCISSTQQLDGLIAALLEALKDSPRVAANAAWAIMNLGDQLGADSTEAQTYKLSPYYNHIVQALLAAAERDDADENCLRTSVYEALSNMVQFCAADCANSVSTVAQVIVERLERSVQQQETLLNADDKNAHTELQMALCGVVQSLARRLQQSISNYSDRLMTCFFQILQTSQKHAVSAEDAFLAIGVIVNVMEGLFSRYVDAFMPFLQVALQNHSDHALCSIAVGIVGDLGRALGEGILQYCDGLMTILISNLQSPVLHRAVKPNILSCFGDIALAISSKFESYLQVSMQVLDMAGKVQAEAHDLDMIDYVNELREGILEAYTGIVQGFKMDQRGQVLLPYFEGILALLYAISQDVERSEEVTRGAVGLLGDLADTLRERIKEHLKSQWVDQFLNGVRQSRLSSSATKEVLKWSRAIIKQVTM